MSFEPKIVAFLCNWCSYRITDASGVSSVKLNTNIRPIRVMCSGRVEPDFILRAFESGADGVLVFGCQPGDCHYSEGNYKTLRRIALLKKTLSQLGIEDGRLRLEWVSPSEGDRFLAITGEMTEQVRKLGPFSGRNGGSHE
ncbi:MAG: hydrogenase iron-sulfur subunit [Dehalococcoidales bacterium]|jgi:F420-non-reducing hydrogenase iron-sulfur subunit